MRLAAALACTVLLATACGAERSEPEGAARPGEEQTVSTAVPTEDQDGSGSFSFSVIALEHPNADPVPVRRLYSAFRRPAAARDQNAAEWAEDQRMDAPEPGSTPVVAEARLLLNAAGLNEEDLVAAPSGALTMCVGLHPMGPAGCGQPTEFGLDINGEVRGKDLLIYGLVADGVRSVDVVVAGRKCEARMGENAFACALRGIGKDRIERVVLHLQDGSTETIPLGG